MLSPRPMVEFPDLPEQPRNSGYHARLWNRRSGGWASTSTGRSDPPLKSWRRAHLSSFSYWVFTLRSNNRAIGLLHRTQIVIFERRCKWVQMDIACQGAEIGYKWISTRVRSGTSRSRLKF